MAENKKEFNRDEERKFGCDICHKDIATERFEGYLGNIVWICRNCYKEIVNYGK